VAMEKVFSPSGWDWGDVPVACVYKLGRDGRLGPNDRREFVKRAGHAGANIFADRAGRLSFVKDEVPVHLIALGASEAWGPNRNGDAFPEPVLKRSHDTFVKFAYWFRNHRNKKEDGHPHYGVVKASAYNPEMRRVELLVGLPATDRAAREMGCDGPADREVEKLARGEDIAVSMACRVPYDVCSGCGNKARTREEYCRADSCPYGGCRDNLTRLVKKGGDVHLLHVVNDDPVFFDISNVFRPADRTAYAGRADWVKSAAAGAPVPGGAAQAAAWAVTAPLAVVLAQDAAAGLRPRLAEQLELARRLDDLERRPDAWDDPQVKRAFAAEVQPPLDLAAFGLGDGRADRAAAVLGALADRKVVLTIDDFARLTGRAEKAAAAAARLPGVYGRMLRDGSLPARLAANPYDPGDRTAAVGRYARAFAKAAVDHSLAPAAVRRRAVAHAVRGLPVPPAPRPPAAADDAAERLARDYACYKLAALHRMARDDDEFVLTARLATCQNHVSRVPPLARS